MKAHLPKIVIASLMMAAFITSYSYAQDTTDIYGAQSGQLGPGVCIVISDIWVAEGENLLIVNNTEFLFNGHYGFDVHGQLATYGGVDVIIFRPNDGVNSWRGIRFTSTASELCILEGCLITGSDENGIYCDSANVTISGCTISDNSASGNGGGIYVLNCSPLITGCDITDNSCSDYGGGIYLAHSNPDILSCSIVNNYADDLGGGIYCWDSNPDISGGIITGNSAYRNGGGIYIVDSSPTIGGSGIFYNTAGDFGGGVCLWVDASPVFNPLSLCDIYENYAGCGSDLFGQENQTYEVPLDTFTVMNPTEFHAYPLVQFNFSIQNATVDQVDADLYVNPTGDDTNSGLTAQDPLQNISYALSKILADEQNPHTIYLADGVHNSSASGTILPLNMVSYVSIAGESENNTILDPENSYYGMYFYHDDGIDIENLTVTHGGGYYEYGVYCHTSGVSFTQCTITDNSGGGIYCYESNSEFSHCTVSMNDGSGIYCESYCDVIISNCTISDNTAVARGGGIYFYDNCNGTIEYSTITDNSASSDGGGIYLLSYCSPDIYECTITDNGVGESGGGICCREESDPHISYCDISHNSALGWTGGGICADASPTIERCLISNNEAGEGGGITVGAYYAASPEIIHCTIVRNEANSGNAIQVSNGSSPTVVNTNMEAHNQASYVVHLADCPNTSITYCDIYNDISAYLVGGINLPDSLGIYGTVNVNGDSTDPYHNIYADPLMIDPEAGNFYLQAGSPCINAGDPTMPLDPDGSIADIGAFYYGQVWVDEPNKQVQPTEFCLMPNYPNPFNPETTLSFALPKAARVELSVYDVSGRLVTSLVDGWREAGYHQVIFDASNYASGIYLARISAGDFSRTLKMVLVK